MPRYLVERKFEVGEAQMPEVGRRSRRLLEEQYPEVRWEHSHVVVDADSKVRTFCIYEAPSEAVVRAHANELGMHQIESVHEMVGDVTPADFPPV